MKEYTPPKKPHFRSKLKGITPVKKGKRCYFTIGELNKVFGKHWDELTASNWDKQYLVSATEFTTKAVAHCDKLSVSQLKKLYSLVWALKGLFNEVQWYGFIYNICVQLQKVSPKYNFPEIEFDSWRDYRYEFNLRDNRGKPEIKKLILKQKEELAEVRYGYAFGDNIAPPKKREVETDATRLERLFNLP